jgi:hypothetical protein
MAWSSGAETRLWPMIVHQLTPFSPPPDVS